MRFRKTCTAISAPRLVPQPNCVPWKSIQHFEHIRRNVFPIAIGRNPPSVFRSPISLAPKKKGLNPTGICPLRQYLVRLLASGG